MPWRELGSDYRKLRDCIEQCQRGVTDGFTDFDRKLTTHGRFALPNSAAQRRWRTPAGKARFIAHPIRDDTPLALARRRFGDEVLALMTLRAHDQFNTTVYSRDDRYRDVEGERRVLFMHADDLAARGLRDGDRIDIETLVDDGHSRRVEGFSARAHDIARGCVAAYFPEASGLIAAGVYADGARTPLYKEMPVRVRKHQPGA